MRILAIGLIIVLFLAGCTSPPSTGTGNNGTASASNPTTQPSSAMPAELQQQLNICIAPCEQMDAPIYINRCKADCYIKIAKEANNADYCVPILALAKKNMESELNRCLKDVGEQLQSAAPCEKAANEYHRNTCIGEVAQRLKNPSLCNQIATSDPDQAINTQAIKDSCTDNAS